MADGTTLNPGALGDTIRDVDKGANGKTQVVLLDIGGLGAESLLTGALPVSQSGAWSVGQSGAWNITNITGTMTLPTGASTAARQDTGNVSLASIDGKLANPLPVTGPLTDAQLRAVAVPVSGGADHNLTFAGDKVDASGSTVTVNVGLTDTQLRATPVPVSGTVAVNTISGFALESGGNLAAIAAKDFATSAKQDTGNTSLSTIATRTPALGQAAMAASSPVVIASDQATFPVTVTFPTTQPVSISSVPLPTNAAQEAGGTLDRLAASTRLLSYIQLQSLKQSLAGSNGFVPMEIPEFLIGV